MNDPDQIYTYDIGISDTFFLIDMPIEPHIPNCTFDTDTDSDTDVEENKYINKDEKTNRDEKKYSQDNTAKNLNLVSDVTEIIKTHVQNLMMFNCEFPKLYQLFKRSTSSQKHNIILTTDMPPKMKAQILGLLSEKDFLRIMMNDTPLMEDVMMHLDNKCLLSLIVTMTDQSIIPILIKLRTFLTISRVKQLKKFGSDLYGLDYHHVIANHLDNASEDTLSESIKCIDPNVLPDDSIDAKNVVNVLSVFISTAGRELLTNRLGLHTEREKIKQTKETEQTALSLIIDHSVKKPIKWMVDVSGIIINTSTDVLGIKIK